VGLVLGGGVDAGQWVINGQVINFTLMVNAIITFVITLAVIYFIFVLPMNKYRERMEAKEAAEKANIEKSLFLASMSHEIRTPMNGLLGIIGLLQNTKMTKEQEKLIGIISESGESLLAIVNDILDYSKIEAGKLELNPVNFDVRKELTRIVNIFSGMAQAKKIKIRLKVDVDIPDFIELDKDKLSQIFINIIGNAVKFSYYEGEISIIVKGEILFIDNLILHCIIKDNGVGIPEDKLGMLTMPFTQVQESQNLEYKGTGLGLAIANRLIELMGDRKRVV
jgi:signal transduction histidine kinase